MSTALNAAPNRENIVADYINSAKIPSPIWSKSDSSSNFSFLSRVIKFTTFTAGLIIILWIAVFLLTGNSIAYMQYKWKTIASSFDEKMHDLLVMLHIKSENKKAKHEHEHGHTHKHEHEHEHDPNDIDDSYEPDIMRAHIHNREINTQRAIDDSNGPAHYSGLSTKKNWCYVGSFNNERTCVEVNEEDAKTTCMSGNIFPHKSFCKNPSLVKSQNDGISINTPYAEI